MEASEHGDRKENKNLKGSGLLVLYWHRSNAVPNGACWKSLKRNVSVEEMEGMRFAGEKKEESKKEL